MDRSHRIVRSSDYAHVRHAGRSWAQPLLICQVAPHDGGTRFGLVVSKKVGKAHDRNRAKRRLRAICRAWLPRLRSGFDVVLIARAGVPTVEFAQLDAAAAALFRRAGIVQTAPKEPWP